MLSRVFRVHNSIFPLHAAEDPRRRDANLIDLDGKTQVRNVCADEANKRLLRCPLRVQARIRESWNIPRVGLSLNSLPGEECASAIGVAFGRSGK